MLAAVVEQMSSGCKATPPLDDCCYLAAKQQAREARLAVDTVGGDGGDRADHVGGVCGAGQAGQHAVYQQEH